MKNLTFAIFMLVLFLVAPLALGQDDTVTETVEPAPTGELQANLLVRPFATLVAGQNLTVEALLLDETTHPLVGMNLIISVNGEQRTTAVTDENGAIEVGLGDNYEYGTYTISVDFLGNETYAPISNTRMLTVVEAGTNANTEVSINPPQLLVGDFPHLTVGQSVTLDVLMLNNIGVPIPNMPLLIFVNGEQVRRARTGEDGRAVVGMGNDFAAETYDVHVQFEGTRSYNSVSVHLPLVVSQIGLTLQTVPPLPNVGFIFNGTTVRTDETGLVTVNVPEPGTYSLEPIPLENDLATPDTMAVFQRWSDSVFDPVRTVEVNRDKVLQAGYEVSHPMSMSFLDLDNEPVAQSRIMTITLKTSTGDRLTFEDGATRWLQSTRINRRREGLEATPILYSVEDVVVDGSNVVNRYQQRFLVEANTDFPVQLLLYYAHIESRDALFGFTVGTGVNVELPSGQLVYFPYDETGSVYIGPLGRGTYTVQPVNIGGMVPVTPMALSRNQEVTLQVLSVFDMVVAVATGIVGALGLLLYGRPQLVWLPVQIVRAIPNSPIAHPRRAMADAMVFARQRLAPVRLPLAVEAPVRPQAQPMFVMNIAPVSYVEVPALALTEEDIKEVEQLRLAARNETIRKRCDIILFSHKQQSPGKVGRQLGYSARTVRRYLARYRDEGITGLFNKPLSSLNEAYLAELVQTVLSHPKDYGCSFAAWTAETLSVVLAGQTGDYIPSEVLEDFMNQQGWYGLYADLTETEAAVDLMPKLIRSKPKQTGLPTVEPMSAN